MLCPSGLCEVDHQNKAGYTAIMLAALTATENPEDMEVAQQLLRMGKINARASQVHTERHTAISCTARTHIHFSADISYMGDTVIACAFKLFDVQSHHFQWLYF